MQVTTKRKNQKVVNFIIQCLNFKINTRVNNLMFCARNSFIRDNADNGLANNNDGIINKKLELRQGDYIC